MTDEVRILLVDDHALVRSALAERLQREPGFVVVGTAGTAEAALRNARESKPHVVLTDIDMPGLNCFEAARTLIALQPDIRVIFLSAFLHDRYIAEALAVKAHGYLTKREPPEQVVAAIREVASGGAFFSDEVRSRIVVDASGARLRAGATSRVATLSRRELEVLRYIARGLGKKEIASITHLSVKTIEHHTTRLMNRLDIHDRVELTRFALREGLAEV